MAANRTPIGSVVRPPPDWFGRHLMGAWATQGPCVGAISIIGLYNNASDGSVIRVYGLNYAAGAATQIYFTKYQGTLGTLATGLATPGMMYPGAPLEWGQVWTLPSAASQGTVFGAVTAFGNVAYDLAPGYPLGIITPGWTFALQTNVTNIILNVGFRFLSVYD